MRNVRLTTVSLKPLFEQKQWKHSRVSRQKLLVSTCWFSEKKMNYWCLYKWKERQFAKFNHFSDNQPFTSFLLLLKYRIKGYFWVRIATLKTWRFQFNLDSWNNIWRKNTWRTMKLSALRTCSSLYQVTTDVPKIVKNII